MGWGLRRKQATRRVEIRGAAVPGEDGVGRDGHARPSGWRQRKRRSTSGQDQREQDSDGPSGLV
jgi:hypothetical protein